MVSDRQTQLGERLRAGGYRLTTPRRLVIEMLAGSDECLTAEQIHDRLKARVRAGSAGQALGLTTIYRTLGLLARLNEVVRIEAGDGRARFELVEHGPDEHHHHLICTSCHRIRKYAEFSQEELTLMARTESSLEERFGYTITAHTIYFYGICPECRAAGNA